MTDEVSGQMGECRLCRRSFFVEKLAKHEKVCPGIKVQTGKKVKNVGCATVKSDQKSVPDPGKSRYQKSPDQPVKAAVPKWKRESNALKDAMKAARAYASKDPKKIAELGPSVASEPDPDLVQCPHCSRRFNEDSAKRHIEHCKNTQNRPKRLIRGQGGAGGGNKGAPIVSRNSTLGGNKRR